MSAKRFNERVTDRREVLRLLAGTVGVLAVGGLASCGPGGDTDISADFTPTRVAAPDDLSEDGSYAEAEVDGLPVAVLASTQATAGSVAKGELHLTAFSRVCKHNGCTVGLPVGGIFVCSCHGSRYSRRDGSVLQGPAEEALAQYRLRVEQDGSVTATGLVRP